MTNAMSPLNAALRDRYSIERELGEGAMAAVYPAEDPRPGRIVERPWGPLALALLVFFATAEVALGQELETFWISGRSDNPAFESYSGLGVATSFILTSRLRIRAAWEQGSATTARAGWVCTIPGNWICAFETGIVDEARRRGASVMLLADLALSDRVKLSAGAGPHFTRLEWDATSEYGRSGVIRLACDGYGYCAVVKRRPRVLAPKTPQFGVVLGGEVRIRPVATMPVVISAGWDRKQIIMDGCLTRDEVVLNSTLTPRTYTPFCGWYRFDELRLSIGVVF